MCRSKRSASLRTGPHSVGGGRARGGGVGAELPAGYWGFYGVGRAASISWAIKQECSEGSLEADLGESQGGKGDRGVYGLGELEGGCSGCLGGLFGT